jgi:hypothetical protein
VKRRDLLRTIPLAAIALASTKSRAIGPKSEISVGRVKHGGNWDTRPESLRRLLWEVGKRTSINVARDSVVVSLEPNAVSARDDGNELFWQPLLVMTGEGDFPPLDARARARLERHLRFGGTLFIDAPSANDPFYAAAKREIATVFPSSTPRALDAEHVVYKSFYLLDEAVGRTKDDKHLYGVDPFATSPSPSNQSGSANARTAVIFSTNDLLGALERDRFGTWKFDCEPDGESQREFAFRLATNIMMYATCLDYKADQVHIPFIMKKKRH